MSNTDAERIPRWTRGEHLAKARKEAGLTRADMADYLGLSPQAISNYELDVRPVKLQTLRLWALRCNVPLDWLRYGDKPPTPNPDRPADQPKRGSYWNKARLIAMAA